LLSLVQLVFTQKWDPENDVYKMYVFTRLLADKVFRELHFQDEERLCRNSSRVSELMSEYFESVATRAEAAFF
jgi:hypothetical protein